MAIVPINLIFFNLKSISVEILDFFEDTSIIVRPYLSLTIISAPFSIQNENCCFLVAIHNSIAPFCLQILHAYFSENPSKSEGSRLKNFRDLLGKKPR